MKNSLSLKDNDTAIDAAFNMSFFERIIAFIREILIKIIGDFPAVL